MLMWLTRLMLMWLLQSRARPWPPRKAIRFRPMRRLRLTRARPAADQGHRSGTSSREWARRAAGSVPPRPI
jgi:hypothetical protein